MTHYVKMTIDEYTDLVNTQNEPSELLKVENRNLKTRLDAAYNQIKELEAGLSQYIIGGMKPISTPSVEPEYTSTPKSKKWNHLEDLLIVDTSYSVSAIVQKTGRTRSSVLSRISRLGYKTKNDEIYLKEE